LFLALLICLFGCSTSPSDDDDSSPADDDDSGADDDDDSFAGIVAEPGAVSVFLASAEAAGIEFEPEVELPHVGLRVRECGEEEEDDGVWHDVPIEGDGNLAFGSRVPLPPLPEGAQLCGVELTFEETLELAGSYEGVDGLPQPFVMLLNPEVLVFNLPPAVVGPEEDIGFLLQIAQENWVSPHQIGVPPEPKRGAVVVVNETHIAYNSCIQQVEAFSHVYLDQDGDGQIGGVELSGVTDQGEQLPRADGKRFAALGESRCLDENGVELEACVEAEFYAPLVYTSNDQGVSWFLAETPALALPAQLRSAAYSDGLYLAVGEFDSDASGQADKGIVLSSIDAEVWGGWIVETPLAAITKGEGENPWVVLGSDGESYHSRNGFFWSRNPSATAGIEFNDVVWSQAGFYLGVGGQAEWALSGDGANWVDMPALGSLLSSGNSDLHGAVASSEGKVVVVGDSGAWLVLENPEEMVAGTEIPFWTAHTVPFSPDLTDVAVYEDSVQGESAVAVSPAMSAPVLVTQSVGSVMVALDPQLTELDPGVRGASITVMGTSTFAMGGPEGLSCWTDEVFDATAGTPHSDVNHRIDGVMVGGN